jgi:hypothetical protein
MLIPEPNSGCWLFDGATTGGGYGRHSKRKYAHRIAYEKWVGPIPDGMLVCHKCDVKLCCNPDHLFLGTDEDNIMDCIKKGRWKVPGNLFQKGHRHPPERIALMRERRWRIAP